MLNRKCYRVGLKWQYIAIIATFLFFTYFIGQNRPPKKLSVNRHFKLAEPYSPWDDCYPAMRSIGRHTKLRYFTFLCTVTDFSAWALPIGVKFCMAVRPDLGLISDRFSPIWGIAPGMTDFWASTKRDMLLAEALDL